MSQSCSCPVCGRQGLPPDCAVCPQCDSDLTCFQVLDAISNAKAQLGTATARPRFPWLAAAGLLLTAAVLALLIFLMMTDRLSKPQRPVTATETKQEQRPVPLISEKKIHIDAQIRIVDERRQEFPLPAAAKSSSTEEAAQEKDTDLTPSASDILALPDVENAAAAKSSSTEEAAQEKDTDLTPSASDILDLPNVEHTAAAESAADDAVTQIKVVELSTPQMKKAVATSTAKHEPVPPSKLPVIKSSRKKRRFQQSSTALKTTVKKTRRTEAKTVTLARSATAKRKAVTPFFFYQAAKTETVWELAKRFYGNRKYYPVLMELNPQIRSGSVKSGSTIRLFIRLRAAASFYQRNIEQRDSLLLWKHKVRPGETWQSLYARFFPPRYSGMVFYPENQQVTLGKTVRIILH